MVGMILPNPDGVPESGMANARGDQLSSKFPLVSFILVAYNQEQFIEEG
jgi:hypothetical protein